MTTSRKSGPESVVLIDPAGWLVVDRQDDGAAYTDGLGLNVIVSVAREQDGRLWKHVSCSRPGRVPSWDDVRRVKQAFVGDAYAAMVFPPARYYVNLNPHVLHLFSPHAGGGWPLPEFSRGGSTL